MPVALSTTTSWALASVTDPHTAAAIASSRLNGLVVWSCGKYQPRGCQRMSYMVQTLQPGGRTGCWKPSLLATHMSMMACMVLLGYSW